MARGRKGGSRALHGARAIGLQLRSALAGSLLVLTAGLAAASGPGVNGGIRVLLHVEPCDLLTDGITSDPCWGHVPLTSPEEFVVNYPATGDTVTVWAYLYHPRSMAVSGVGYAIEYDGVDLVTSGVCADVVGQQPEIMGTWPESGSEMAMAWVGEEFPRGQLHPISWFVLAAQDGDGYFRLDAGQSSFSGVVGDTSGVPYHLNAIWAYGQIGFGNTAGELPVPKPEEIPGAWGAVGVELR